MPAQTILSSVLDLIFAKMTTIFKLQVGKHQRRFLSELFRVVFALQGRATFTNMARFSCFSEQTFRRHFSRAFDWVAFNLIILRLRVHPRDRCIGVFDTSFLPKSGKHTWGLDKFFSSTAKRTQRGLEVSLLGVIAVESREAFALDATQTPPGLAAAGAARASGRPTADITSAYSRIDFYLEQITDTLDRLSHVAYFVGDGYYAKSKVFDTLTRHDKHLITRLRPDANLRFLAQPWEQNGRGRRRRYAGKVRFADFDSLESRFSEEGVLADMPHVRIYTALVNSTHFKRDLRVVVLHDARDGRYVVLASTSLEQTAEEVVAFYRLRYQLEFIIRDAKQFTGLTHCQARGEAELDFHLNMSVAAVNLARLVSRRMSMSLSSYAREAYNTFLVGRLLSELSLDAEFAINHPGVMRVIGTGRIAA